MSKHVSAEPAGGRRAPGAARPRRRVAFTGCARLVVSLAVALMAAACASSPPAGAAAGPDGPAAGALAEPVAARESTPGPSAPATTPATPDSFARPAHMPPAPPPAVFVDLDRNLKRLTSPEAIFALVDTAASAGIRRIVVGVKKRDGSVLFRSRVAATFDPGFDYFDSFRQACRRHGIELVAHLQILTEGDPRTRTGPAFDHPEWQQVVSDPDRGLVPQGSLPTGAGLLASPILNSVQRYEATVFSDLLQQLKPDAVYLDELRFYDRTADVSDSAHATFDRWHGLSPTVDWPTPVLDKNNPRYASFIAFRAATVYELFMRMKKLRDAVAPGVPLVLGGPGYFEPSLGLGVNWAHSSFRPSLWYYTDGVRRRALTDEVDQLLLICNETSPAAVREVVRGIDVLTARQRPAAIFLSVDRFQRRPGRLLEAIQTARDAGFGIVLGDAGQLGAAEAWDVLREAIGRP